MMREGGGVQWFACGWSRGSFLVRLLLLGWAGLWFGRGRYRYMYLQAGLVM